MKKELFICFAVLCMIVVVTGCDKKEEVNRATITNNNGVTENLSAQELIDIYNDNSVSFEELYYKGKIDVTDEVEKVSESGMVVCVYLKNNWVIAYHRQTTNNPESFLKEAGKLNSGDKIRYVGKIYSAKGYCSPSNEGRIELNLVEDYILEVNK